MHIEKLNGDNWTTWKFQMEHLLKGKGFWDHVAENTEPPGIANMQARQEFLRKRERAFAIIVLSINTSQLYLVTSCTTPKEAWDVLRNHYERNTLANKLFLKKKYFRCEMPESMTVEEHLKQMKELTDQLAAVGAEIAEEDQIVTLLGSLPDSYQTLVTALETRLDDISLGFVQQALVNEEHKRKANDSEKSIANAAAATHAHSRSGQNKHMEGNTQKKFKCYSCGEFGHIKRNCPNRKKPEHKAKTVESDTSESMPRDDSSGCAFAVSRPNDELSSKQWIVDSGASRHMTCEKECLLDYHQFRKPQLVRVGDGRTVEALGAGNVQLTMTFKVSDPKCVTMYNVLFVPKLAGNLFSVGAAAEKGNYVQFTAERCYIRGNKGTLHGMGDRKADGLYMLNCTANLGHKAAVAANGGSGPSDVDLWHQRLGHLNMTQLKQITGKDMATGITMSPCNTLFCEGCIEGKMFRKPFKSNGEVRAKHRLELVHSDVCGPMQTQSIGGSKYFVTFIDDFTRCCKVYFMKSKAEVLEKFKEFERIYSNECGARIKAIRTDNGGEYVSQAFKDYLAAKGIRHEKTAPYSPQQNGVAERRNRTLVESARSMISHAGLSKQYWAEAVATAAYVGNRVPTSAISDNKTPYERWYGKKPDLSHMKVFGCVGYAHVPDELRKKLDMKAEKLRFIGYSSESKAYRFYNEQTRKVIIRRDAVFNEENFELHEETKENTNEVVMDLEEASTTGPAPVNGRIRRAPVRYGFDEYADMMSMNEVCHVALPCTILEPSSMQEAMSSENADKWKEAANAEYDSLMKNETWSLVELPKDRKVIGSKWVFKVKSDSEGHVERFKSRLVAKGYDQRYGFDEYADVCHIANTCGIEEPRTLNEALQGDNANDWRAAADSEFNSLLENDTWKLVEVPPDSKTMWILVVSLCWISFLINVYRLYSD